MFNLDYPKIIRFKYNLQPVYLNYKMSKDNKSSALWNMLDPDDPYDIKKSMIAKLPDHPPQPMGRHLELVCLLQAAEIQRLSEYLTEIKAKYREVERRELDRHSYEIQIKELAEKNISLNNMRIENDRLKDFIKRQSFELEELQKKNIASVNFETLQAKYEGLLNQLRLARGQNQNAEKTNARLNVEINQWRLRCEKYEQQKSMMNSQFEVQMRQRITQQIKIVREKSEQRFQRLQIDYRRLSQSLQSKNQQILILQGHKEQLLKQIKMLQQKNKNKGNIEQAINQKNRQIQRINTLLIQKTSKLQQSMSSNQKLGGQLNILQERYRNMEKDRQRLLIRIKELQSQVIKNQSFERMEDKVVMMSMEIQRLNALLATRAKECAEAHGQIERLKFQLRNNAGNKDILERQRQRIGKLQGEIQMLRVNENRFRIATQQLQRIKQVLNAKNEQYYILQQKFSSVQVTNIQITNLTKQKSRLQQQLSSSLQKIQNLKANLNLNQASAMDLAKMAKDKSMLEQELQSSRSQLRNYRTSVQSELSMLRGENQRLRQQLQQISQFKGQTQKYRIQLQRNRNQSNQLKGEIMNLRRISQQQRSFRLKLQSQKNSLMSSNQEMLSQLLNLKKQIESLKLMAKSFDEKERIIHSLEMDIRNLQANFSNLEQQYMASEQKNEKLQVTIKSIYEQISRLHSVLSTKTNQCQKLSRDISQLEERCRFYETKMSNGQGEKQFYQNQIRRLKGQLQNVSKNSNEVNRELSVKRNEMMIEKQKIEKIIVQKQTLILEYRKQKQTLERQLVQIQRQQSVRISTEQQLRTEREQLIQIRQRMLEDLRSKDNTIVQLQKAIGDKDNDTRQSDNKIRLWQSRINQWQNRMKDTQKTIRMRQQQISRLRQQKDRILLQLQRANGELQESNRIREMIILQNNQIKKKIEEILRDQRGRNSQQQLRNQIKQAQQALFRQRRQSQSLKGKCKNLQQLLSTQSRQIQQSRQSIRQYQMKIVHIQSTQSRIIQERCRQYEIKLQQKDSLIINLQKQVNQMESQLKVILSRDQDTVNNLRNYEDKVSLLSVEIQRLNIKIQDKNRECREKDLLIQRGSQADPATLDKIRQYQSKLSFYSSQFQKLTAQINRKDQQLSQKDNYIQQLTYKLNQSAYTQAGKTNMQQYQIQIKNLKVALEQYENINLHTAAQRDELFQVSHELKEQLDRAHSQFAETEKNLRSQIAYKSQQNRRFGEQLGQLKKRQQSLLLKIQQLERQARSQQQNNSLKMRMSELQLRLQSLSKQNQQLSIHNLNLKQEVSQLLIINQQINMKLIDGGSNIKEQLSRLTIRIKEYATIIQNKDQQLSQWDVKYNQLYGAYEELYTNYQVTKGEYEKTIANIKIYESKLFKIEQDYQSIGIVLRGKQKQIYDLKVRLKGDGDLYEKNLILSKQIDRLTLMLENSQLQVRQLRLSMTDNLSLQKRIEEQLALMVVLFAEIQSLRSRLVLTERECQEVRRSSIVPCRVDKNKENRL